MKAANLLPEGLSPTFVCVIPVRMQEAWSLIDETAIKVAAGNRNYDGQLELPPVSRLERIPDPKDVLNGLLRQASDLNRRRQRNFSVAKHAKRVTEFIEDFSPLRRLSAIAALEREIRSTILENNWQF